MLRYTEVCLSGLEVPGEVSICIYISGCCQRCFNCHYPLLQSMDYGEKLADYYNDIIAIYRSQATCVCFLGEGKNTEKEHQELLSMVRYANEQGLKTCLYSGRDTDVEPWMCAFDYVKLGSYIEARGALGSENTNQVMLSRSSDGAFADITYKFRLE